MKKILVLTDGKAGHENQSRAFASRLSLPFDVVKVSFKSPLHKIASYVFGRFGVFAPELFTPRCTGDYAAVIGAGSGVFYAVKNTADRCSAASAAVLYPRGYRISSFDCVLAPAFDRPRAAANVIEIPANLVSSDSAFYERAAVEFKTMNPMAGRKPAVAVIIGGANRRSTMDPGWVREQLETIFRGNEGREFWVTTSRRTSPEVEEVVDSFRWDYKLLYSRDKFNPIPAFVMLAERIYVSAESTGMISEACSFGGAEVRIMDNLRPGKHKFRRFVDMLKRDGYIGGRRKIDLTPVFSAAKKLLGL